MTVNVNNLFQTRVKAFYVNMYNEQHPFLHDVYFPEKSSHYICGRIYVMNEMKRYASKMTLLYDVTVFYGNQIRVAHSNQAKFKTLKISIGIDVVYFQLLMIVWENRCE